MADKKISQLTSATTPLAGTETLPVVQSGATVKVAVSDLTAGRAVSMSGFSANTSSTYSTGNIVGNLGAYSASGSSGGSPLGAQIYLGDSNFNNSSYYNAAPGIGAVFNAGTSVASDVGLFTYSGTPNSRTLQVLVDTSGNATLKTGNLVQGTAAKGVNFTANTPAAGMTSQLLNWYEEGTWTPDLLIAGGNTGVTYTTQTGRYTRVGRQVMVECSIVLSSKGARTGAVRIGGLPYTLAIDALPATIVPTGTWALLLAGGGVQAYISGTAVYLLLGTTTGTTALTDTNLSNTSAFTFTATFTV